MRKLVGMALAVVLVLGVVGVAAAENGSVLPWGAAKVSKVRLMENGSVLPW